MFYLVAKFTLVEILELHLDSLSLDPRISCKFILQKLMKTFYHQCRLKKLMNETQQWTKR